jgi:hypothetical protein
VPGDFKVEPVTLYFARVPSLGEQVVYVAGESFIVERVVHFPRLADAADDPPTVQIFLIPDQRSEAAFVMREQAS